MLYLIISIVCSVAVSVLLKVARGRGIVIEQAIAVNYVGAALCCGYFLRPDLGQWQNLLSGWPLFLALGVLLPSVFVIMGRSVAVAGIVKSDAAQRLSLFLPVAVGMLLFKSYRITRLMAFLDPWKDPRRSGFQIIQSLISFGSGGPFGVGIGDGMQKLFYLPEPHTDFILAVIAEESGFIGVGLILFLYVILIVRGFQISLKAPDLFGNLLAAGLTMMIALEAFINIAGVMGLIPLKGLALPFLSYGGTSLIMSLTAVGILLNISSYES